MKKVTVTVLLFLLSSSSVAFAATTANTTTVGNKPLTTVDAKQRGLSEAAKARAARKFRSQSVQKPVVIPPISTTTPPKKEVLKPVKVRRIIKAKATSTPALAH